MNKHTASTATASKKMPIAADSIADSVQTLVDQGAETIDAIKARVTEVTDEARTLLDRTTKLVKQHPLTSMVVSFGAGYIAMRITTSRITQLAMLGGLIYGGSRLMKR